MKLIIAGSRSIADLKTIRKAVHKSNISIKSIQEVVSGTAKGADILGEWFAIRFKINIKRFPPDWDKHGKSAGYIRNAEMAKYADALLAVWDGSSKGTKHMINLMERENKPVFIYIPDIYIP